MRARSRSPPPAAELGVAGGLLQRGHEDGDAFVPIRGPQGKRLQPRRPVGAERIEDRETFAATHTDHAPWTVIKADDKRRARIAALRRVLSQVPYAGRDDTAATPPDPAICGGPDLWNG